MKKDLSNSELFDRYQQNEKALNSCRQEMVIQGVVTRRIQEITIESYGASFSKSQVLEMTRKLEEQVRTCFTSRWKNEKVPNRPWLIFQFNRQLGVNYNFFIR